MMTALAGLVATVAIATALFPRYGHVGVAAGIALSGWVGAVSLAVVLARRNWIAMSRSTLTRILCIIGATLVMGCAVALAMVAGVSYIGVPASFIARLLWLAVLIGVGGIVYLFGLQQLGIANVRELVAAVRARP
jgi:putative peptidoglycan lipid II flippase